MYFLGALYIRRSGLSQFFWHRSLTYHQKKIILGAKIVTVMGLKVDFFFWKLKLQVVCMELALGMDILTVVAWSVACVWKPNDLFSH